MAALPIAMEELRRAFAAGAAGHEDVVLQVGVEGTGIAIMTMSAVKGEEPIWVNSDAHAILSREGKYATIGDKLFVHVLKPPAHEFKFRAGCKDDADRFAEKAGVEITLKALSIEFDGRRQWIPDVEGAFTTTTGEDELRRVAQSIQDCHVLAETLRRSADYTGEGAYGATDSF